MPNIAKLGLYRVKRELAENALFLLLLKTLSTGGSYDRTIFSNYVFWIFFAFFPLSLLGLPRCPMANLIDDMEPR